MRIIHLAIVVAASAASAEPPSIHRPAEDPKVAPYERLFALDATFTLACFTQHQVGVKYDPACTAQTCDRDGALVCTVEEHRNVATTDVSHVACTRTKADGTSSTRDSWYVRTPTGLWLGGATLPTKHDVAMLERGKPYVAEHPIVGVIKPKRDPDGEDDRVTGSWLGDRYCRDTEVGKSNTSWNRWCVSRSGGVIGTLHTTAESAVAERCGEPL